MGAEFDRLRVLCEKVHNPGAEVSGEAQVEQFPHQYVWFDGIKGRAVIVEELSECCPAGSVCLLVCSSIPAG